MIFIFTNIFTENLFLISFTRVLSRKKHNVKIVILKEIFRDRLDGTRFTNNVRSLKVFPTNSVTTTNVISIAPRTLGNRPIVINTEIGILPRFRFIGRACFDLE